MRGSQSELTVHFIMAADIQQDDFLVGYDNCQSDSIAVGNTDCLDTLEFAAKVVILQVGLEWVALQITEDFSKLNL